MSVSVEYQKYLSQKLAKSLDISFYYLLCKNIKGNFALPMDILKNLILWQKPKPIYPMPKHILGFILVGQIPTTIISLENIDSLCFYHKPSEGGVYYKYIAAIKGQYQLGLSVQNCHIALLEDLDNATILNQDWFKNNLFNIS